MLEGFRECEGIWDDFLVARSAALGDEIVSWQMRDDFRLFNKTNQVQVKSEIFEPGVASIKISVYSKVSRMKRPLLLLIKRLQNMDFLDVITTLVKREEHDCASQGVTFLGAPRIYLHIRIPYYQRRRSAYHHDARVNRFASQKCYNFWPGHVSKKWSWKGPSLSVQHFVTWHRIVASCYTKTYCCITALSSIVFSRCA